MPVDDTINYSKRDKQTLERIETAKKSADILKSFFEKGFKSFEALSSIVSNYYPDMSVDKLKNFWHFRHVDEGTYSVLQDVYERLKSE